MIVIIDRQCQGNKQIKLSLVMLDQKFLPEQSYYMSYLCRELLTYDIKVIKCLFKCMLRSRNFNYM